RADRIAPYVEVARDAVLPTELPLFSDAQYAQPGFPFRPFDPTAPLNGVWGWSFQKPRKVLVPAAAVYYGQEDPLLVETSSGVAAHSARAMALNNALCELIESDAFF